MFYRKKKAVLAAVIMVVFLLFLLGCQKAQDDVVPTMSQQIVIDEEITLLTLGDNLLHMPVVNSGKKEDGTYSYSHIFEHLQPEIKNADIAVIGQETIFGGEALGYSGYPLFNSPDDMGRSLVDEGFDIVLHASNHVLDKGVKGINHTLEFWKNYPQIEVLGINNDETEKNTVDIINVKGANISVLNYTYGTNGISLPAGSEYMVNYIDKEKIMQDAIFSEENADFTIAFMHWGTEYSTKPNENQKALAKEMCSWGIDLIIGSHPHVIEPLEWVESENGNKMLVYYSLGNFVSRQKEARNLLGAMANVVLKYDGHNVTISDYKFVPIVTHYNKTSTDFDVYPLKNYSDELALQHGIAQYDGAVSVKRWSKMLTETFDGYDKSAIDMYGLETEAE